MENTVLFVMDVQKDFTEPNARMPVCQTQVEPMLSAINKLIEQANARDTEVIYIANEFEKNDWIANWFRNYAAVKGQPGAALDERLKIVNSLYSSKNKPDALTNPRLRELLSKMGTKHIIIVGLFAEGCVSATALSALRSGYKVSVIQDATAGKNDLSRDKAMTKLAQRGVTVCLSRDVFSNN
jgi:maleamate amidohydrolase